ncbi:MAG: hypothetical protein LUO87_03585 [Methanomicrobiales archaeon]|nr:hypothetical protein [Methanomicrobiales archaeon]MDD1659988.1 hypothetical protein [Methanomicrobiales archaeon]
MDEKGEKEEERKAEAQKGEPKVPEEGRKEGEPKEGAEIEDLFDVIVPVGTPRSVLRDVVRKFPVQLVERKMPAYFANMEGDEREVLAFRGPRKVVEEVEQFIRKELEAFIETGGWRKEKPPES